MMKINNYNTISILLIGAIMVPFLATVQVAAEDKTANSVTCAQRVSLLNNRSQLLAAYKQSQEKKYKLEREKWAKRIGYASQWVEKDSNKARDSLYKYDQLHNALRTELDKQIEEYKSLQTNPLVCSDANRDQIKAKLSEVRGIKNKKATGGQALITKLKRQETNYLKGDFNKATDTLIDKLHKEKGKHPTPKQKAFDVKSN